ncbi:MAG: hypothetical protein IJ379_00030 [Lachnospiraceae bacterium]|nr:hypothetical protein [Lachnospiraceae bacterium]
MRNLLKWELKQTFQSKAFWGFGITLTLMNIIFLFITSIDGELRGFELFMQGCSDYNSFILLFIGIFAGIHVAGAFEERKIQAAVMAGNSRFNILAVKLFSFSLSIAAFSICVMGASLIGGVLTNEGVTFVDDFFREVVLRIVAYTLVEVAFVSICFFLSMLVKNLGAAIGVNLVSMLVLNIVGQMLISKEWAVNFMKFTPLGQTFMLLVDASTKNLIVSVAASVLGLAVTVTLSYIKFRKEELK